MFRAADLVLLTKADLLPVLDDFQPQRAERYLRELANDAPVLHTSVRSGAGVEQWLAWLGAELTAQRQRLARGATARPAVQPEGAALHAGEHGHHHPHHHHHHHD
jgi:hydrogenase nickel incorporation protein HypB